MYWYTKHNYRKWWKSWYSEEWTRGKWYPLILNNSNFLVLFRTIYRAGIGQISSSVFPKGENFFQKCLDQATQVCGQHAYICVDANLKNPLNNRYGVRTNIFRENNLPMLIFKNPQNYLKKNWKKNVLHLFLNE